MLKDKFVYTIPDTDISICITYKRIKNICIRVKSADEIVCSAPLPCSKSKITDFIDSKTEWIKKAVQKVKAVSVQDAALPQDGAAISAGFDLSNVKTVTGRKVSAYSKAWQKAALENYTESARRQMSFFTGRHIPSFTVKGRAMKTLWGSCNRRTNTITINWELFKTNQKCIDYVIFHEMTHFLYIHHDKNFYGYIQKYMNDYKDRVHHLNFESGPRL